MTHYNTTGHGNLTVIAALPTHPRMKALLQRAERGKD
jgi:hypothetical protein